MKKLKKKRVIVKNKVVEWEGGENRSNVLKKLKKSERDFEDCDVGNLH